MGLARPASFPLCFVKGQTPVNHGPKPRNWNTVGEEEGQSGSRRHGGTLNALVVGTGVPRGGWGRGHRGGVPIPHPGHRPDSQRHHWVGCFRAGVPVVVVGLSCESGRDRVPLIAKPPPLPLDQNREKGNLAKV